VWHYGLFESIGENDIITLSSTKNGSLSYYKAADSQNLIRSKKEKKIFSTALRQLFNNSRGIDHIAPIKLYNSASMCVCVCRMSGFDLVCGGDSHQRPFHRVL
jgi:hypothetical protein